MNNQGKICLHNNSGSTYTQVSNTFIDEYMPSANGTYVKVYLTLLRLINKCHFNVSLCDIADVLELTEKDVARALKYWEKHQLLAITRSSSGEICDIAFNTPAKNNPLVASNESASATDDTFKTLCNTASVKDKPAEAGAFTSNTETESPNMRKTYSASEIAEISSNEKFIWTVNILEQYMQRTLTPTDIELVVFLFDSLHFSFDLIFFLYEYCIGKGKKNSKYIQAVAINWADSGVDSVEKAENYLALYDSRYMEIMRVFGINQAPAPIQKRYIDTWFSLGFDAAIIKEACNRTILKVNEPNFKYANGILENWHRLGIKTLDDIKVADSAHSHTADNNTTSPKGKTNNAFNSYSQREYSDSEYSDLERQLLNQQ